MSALESCDEGIVVEFEIEVVCGRSEGVARGEEGGETRVQSCGLLCDFRVKLLEEFVGHLEKLGWRFRLRMDELVVVKSKRRRRLRSRLEQGANH